MSGDRWAAAVRRRGGRGGGTGPCHMRPQSPVRPRAGSAESDAGESGLRAAVGATAGSDQ